MITLSPVNQVDISTSNGGAITSELPFDIGITPQKHASEAKSQTYNGYNLAITIDLDYNCRYDGDVFTERTTPPLMMIMKLSSPDTLDGDKSINQ